MRALALALLLVGAGLAQPAAVPVEPDSVPLPETTATTGPVTPMPPAPAVLRSPGRAVLLSALIPGGGQVYTGHLWKSLIIAPAEVTLGYLAVREHIAATDALDAGEEEHYVEHRDRRTAFIWWTGAVLAFSMADAYVSAQMYGFDKQMTLSLGPGRLGIEVGLGRW